MRHAGGSASWTKLLGFVVVFVNIVTCQARWDDLPWVRGHRCDHESYDNVTSSTPFWITGIRGEFSHDDVGATKLFLSILSVQNKTLFNCQELDIMALEKSLAFEVLGYPVGQVTHFNSSCPLPITDDRTPRPSDLFNQFDIVYSFDRPHRLQTLAAQFRFQAQDGSKFTCMAAKITPDNGPAASAVLTFLPAGVLALVGFASWQKHSVETHFLDHASALTSQQGPVWETILDVAVYLRYLQFVFLSATLSVDYPGFYQPITGQISWASLLYWRGPFDGGWVWTGVEGGLYVSNYTWGLDTMTQMLALPRMEDTIFDALLNFLILVVSLFCILYVTYAHMSKPSPRTRWLSTTRMIGSMSTSVCLSLFSMPLLAYMSYEWIFIGYYSNYRIALFALSMTILLCVHYVITQPFWNHQRSLTASAETGRTSLPSTKVGTVLWHRSQYVPHFIPLLQAIFVGALQNSGLVQVILLGITEAVFLIHATLNRKANFRFSRSKTVWISAFRLAALSLCIAMAYIPREAARQWIGYAMLCLHGVVVFPIFLFGAILQLYHAYRKTNGGGMAYLLDSGSSHLNSQAEAINLDDISSHFISNGGQGRRASGWKVAQRPSYAMQPITHYKSPGEASSSHVDSQKSARGLVSTPAATSRYEVPGFYRKPRTRNTTPTPQFDPISSISEGTSSIFTSINSINSTNTSPTFTRRWEQLLRPHSRPTQQCQDELGVLSEIPVRHGVDYSVRESDRFYGEPIDDELTPPSTATSSEEVEGNQSSQTALYNNMTSKIKEFIKPKKKDRGFQVTRPHLAGQDMAILEYRGAIRVQGHLSGTHEPRLNSMIEGVETEKGNQPISNHN